MIGLFVRLFVRLFVFAFCLPYRLVMGILRVCLEIFFWMWIHLLFGKKRRRW